MTPDVMFRIANLAVMPAWLALVVAPRWNGTRYLVHSMILPLILAGLYTGLLAAGIGDSEGSFNSLEGLAKLFSRRDLLLAGWLHYLAFDLFVGAWETRDAFRCGVSRWILIPCQILTFFAGPVGLLVYLVFRSIRTRTLIIEEG